MQLKLGAFFIKIKIMLLISVAIRSGVIAHGLTGFQSRSTTEVIFPVIVSVNFLEKVEF